MTDSSDRAHPQQPPPVTLTVCLLILAPLCALAGMGVGTWVLCSAIHARVAGPWVALVVSGCFLAGWILGALLWAAAWIVRRMHCSLLAQRAMLRQLSQSAPPAEALVASPARQDDPGATELLQRIASELSRLNSNVLLTDRQRAAKRRKLQEQSSLDLVEQIQIAIDARDFSRAEQLLERLIAEIPDEPRHPQLVQRLADARGAAYDQDVRETARQAEDLMSVGEFAAGRKSAEELLARYPSSVEAIALLDRVRREEAAFVAEKRGRLYRQVEKHVSGKEWRLAVQTAERFLEAYPECGEADLVNAQMGTLCENARIEEVREMRDGIRELLSRRRYAEALSVARDVVDRYPGSAAGEELQRQMPRLEKLAASGGITA